MQVSRIEQKIEDIYAFVESCKMQRLSATKVVVPKNELYDLLDDLRGNVPDEIKRYRKILNQRDAILEDAEKKAQAILSDAQEQYKALIEEHNIMQQAYQQAQATVQEANDEADEIIANARKQAEEIGSGALYYTADILDMAEKVIASAYDDAVNNAAIMQNALKNHLDTIRQNKAELIEVNEPQPEEQMMEEPMQQEEPVMQEVPQQPEMELSQEVPYDEQDTQEDYEQ